MNTRKRLLILMLFVTTQVFSQNSNEFRLYYGVSDSKFLRNVSVDGLGSSDNENLNEFGLRYLRKITKNLFLETGINYLSVEVSRNPASETFRDPIYETVEMISVPVYGNFTFWKYLFVSGGPLFDYQISENASDSQTGIGYSFGFGGKYSFQRFSIFLNPHFKRHAVIPFEEEVFQERLTEFGIQFGLGYNF